MSVLIRGTEMPKDCGHCLLCEQDTIYDALVYRCLVTDNYLDDGYECKIMSNCPLVPVPKHGRLIDADVLFDFILNIYKNAQGDARKAYRDVLDVIVSAGDVIPAEEKTE